MLCDLKKNHLTWDSSTLGFIYVCVIILYNSHWLYSAAADHISLETMELIILLLIHITDSTINNKLVHHISCYH